MNSKDKFSKILFTISTVLLSTFHLTTPILAQGIVDIDGTIARLEKAYGIDIEYQYSESFFPTSWLEPPISGHGSQIALEEVQRFLPIIEDFLSAYSREFLKRNVETIYLLRNMNFFGKDYGGTRSSTAIYITNKGQSAGYDYSYLLGSLHHEFSSLVLMNYPVLAEEIETQWHALNPSGFVYGGTGVEMLGRDDVFDNSEELQKQGFLIVYSSSSFENDFNMIIDYHFSNPDVLANGLEISEAIQAKYQLLKDFYNKIDSGVNFRY